MNSPQTILKNLLPQLIDIETRHKKTIRRQHLYKIGLALFVLASFLAFVRNFAHRPPDDPIYWQLLLIGLSIVAFFYLYLKNAANYRHFQVLQKRMIPEILQDVHPEFLFDKNHHISFEHFQNSNLLNYNSSEFGGGNYFEGTISNTNFQCSEIEIFEKRGGNQSEVMLSETDTSYDTLVFRGLFLVMETPYWHESVTFVLEDKKKRFIGRLSRFFNKQDWKRGHFIFFPEYPEFEKHFKVYGLNADETIKVLTDDLLNKLTEVRANFEMPMHLCFNGDTVYIIWADQKSKGHYLLNKNACSKEVIFKETYAQVTGMLEMIHFLEAHFQAEARELQNIKQNSFG